MIPRMEDNCDVQRGVIVNGNGNNYYLIIDNDYQ